MSYCAICGKYIDLAAVKSKDKERICQKCYNKLGGIAQKSKIKDMTIQSLIRLKDEIEDQERIYAIRRKNFTITKDIQQRMYINENDCTWCIPDGFFGKIKQANVYKYEDILDFELLENGVVTTTKQGGITRAVAGGLLFGGVGAIVGASTSKSKSVNQNKYQVKITVTDKAYPNVYINLQGQQKIAREIITQLKFMYDEAEEKKEKIKKQNEVKKDISIADEIRKYKDLLDVGAISIEEFNAIKKKLIDMGDC